MIKTKEDLVDQVIELKHCIQHTTIDLLEDPDASKGDLISAVISGVNYWKAGMLICIEEENKNLDEN